MVGPITKSSAQEQADEPGEMGAAGSSSDIPNVVLSEEGVRNGSGAESPSNEDLPPSSIPHLLSEGDEDRSVGCDTDSSVSRVPEAKEEDEGLVMVGRVTPGVEESLLEVTRILEAASRNAQEQRTLLAEMGARLAVMETRQARQQDRSEENKEGAVAPDIRRSHRGYKEQAVSMVPRKTPEDAEQECRVYPIGIAYKIYKSAL